MAAPLELGFAYSFALISMWSLFSPKDLAANSSKLCTSNSFLMRPRLSMYTIVPVMPPSPKLAVIFCVSIFSLKKTVVASDAPPVPVWMLKPSLKSPECSMTLVVKRANMSSLGLVVIRVSPAPILAGSPTSSTTTTQST